MSKYDDFDLDVVKSSGIGNEASKAGTALLCQFSLYICTEVVETVTKSIFCPEGSDACTTPSQGCTEKCDQTLSACHSYCGSGCRR